MTMKNGIRSRLAMYMLIPTAAGLYMCAVWLLSGNLFIAVGLHTLMDALAADEGNLSLFISTHTGIVQGVVSLLFLLVLVVKKFWWPDLSRKSS